MYWQAEIAIVNTTEGAAYGAAVLAAVGAGVFRDVEDACKQLVKVTGSTAPGERVADYDKSYAVYRSLYPILKHTFEQIAA